MAIHLDGETVSEDRADVAAKGGAPTDGEGATTMVSAMLTTLGEALGGFDQRLAHLEQAVSQALFENGTDSKALAQRVDEAVSGAATRVEAALDDALRERGRDAEVLDAIGALATRVGQLFESATERITALEEALSSRTPAPSSDLEERLAEFADQLASMTDERLATIERRMAVAADEQLAALEKRVEGADGPATTLVERLAAASEERLAALEAKLAGRLGAVEAAVVERGSNVSDRVASVANRLEAVEAASAQRATDAAAVLQAIDEDSRARDKELITQLAVVRERLGDDLVELPQRIEGGHRQLAKYLRELLAAGLERMQAAVTPLADASTAQQAALEQAVASLHAAVEQAVANQHSAVEQAASRQDVALERLREDTSTRIDGIKVALVAASDQDRVNAELLAERVADALTQVQESYATQAARAAQLADALEEWRNDLVGAVADLRGGAREVLTRVSDGLDDLGRHLTSLASRTEPSAALASLIDGLADQVDDRVQTHVRSASDRLGDELSRALFSAIGDQQAATERVRTSVDGLRTEVEALLVRSPEVTGDPGDGRVVDLLARLGELVTREGDLLTQRLAAVSISVESTRSLLAGFLEDSTVMGRRRPRPGPEGGPRQPGPAGPGHELGPGHRRDTP